MLSMENRDFKESFENLGLSRGSLESIKRKGFERPTEIQAAVIPVLLKDDVDLVGQSRTGTGKTAAFALPVLEKIDPSERSVQVLVLTPTRELAIQVSDEIRSLRHDGRIRIMPIYGGQPIGPQIGELRRGVHVVVGTPGRILDHLRRGTLELDGLRYLILDEADRMLDMGFVDDIDRIISYTPSNRRTLMFSATMPAGVVSMARRYMGRRKVLRVSEDKMIPDEVEQEYLEVEEDRRIDALSDIIRPGFHGIVFCRTKADTREVAWELRRRGFRAWTLNGDMSQQAREKTLNRFRNGRLDVLVATDVASRGLDIRGVSHVVNYSPPENPKDYLHRIGRTGRMGIRGKAITFVRPGESAVLRRMVRAVGGTVRESRAYE
ncbi:MAG: DEAD/DEAH box helicase [Thermococci archaeon]|nr:DEAD/DEAH box helicase [Thermococci archaeon]